MADNLGKHTFFVNATKDLECWFGGHRVFECVGDGAGDTYEVKDPTTGDVKWYVKGELALEWKET